MEERTQRRASFNDATITNSTNHLSTPCQSAGAISNLCSATLGAGALSLPYAFSLTGLIPGVILLLLSGYLTILSIDIIITSCVKTNLFKYEDVAVRLAGRTAGRALEASLLVFCFGTAVAYIVAVGDIVDQFVRSLSVSLGSDKESTLMTIYSRDRVMVLFWLLVMFPLSLQRHVEGLKRFSSVGVLSIIFLVLAAVIHSIQYGDIFGTTISDSDQNKNTDIVTLLWPNSFWDVVQAFPIMIFAFSCQVNVCAIFEELKSPGDIVSNHDSILIKERMMKRIIRSGISLCITLYLAIGIFGYLDFAHQTVDNILNDYNITVTHDPLMTVASISVAIAIIVAYPFNILPARVTLKLIWDRFRTTNLRLRFGILYRLFRVHDRNRSSSMDESSNVSTLTDGNNSDDLESLLLGDPLEQESARLSSLPFQDSTNHNRSSALRTSTTEHFILTLLLSGSALVVALLIPGISVIFGLMGGTAASVISFILPGLFLMQMEDMLDDGDGEYMSPLSKQSEKQKLFARVFIWGGVVIGVLSTGVTVYGLL